MLNNAIDISLMLLVSVCSFILGMRYQDRKHTDRLKRFNKFLDTQISEMQEDINEILKRNSK